MSQPVCYGARTDHLGSWLHIQYDTALCTAFGGTISSRWSRSANRVVQTWVVGFAMETPRVRFFCLLAFVPCFLLRVFRFSFLSFRFFPPSRYVYPLRVPSSVQQPSSTLSKYVLYSTCSFCLRHLYPAPSRFLFFFYSCSICFFVARFSRVPFFVCCALVPGSLGLDLRTLIL